MPLPAANPQGRLLRQSPFTLSRHRSADLYASLILLVLTFIFQHEIVSLAYFLSMADYWFVRPRYVEVTPQDHKEKS